MTPRHETTCHACGSRFTPRRGVYCSEFCRTPVPVRRADWSVVEKHLVALTGRAPHRPDRAGTHTYEATLTARWIADRTGVSARSVYRWRTRGYLTVAALEAIAEALGEHPSALYPDYYDLTNRGECP